jgi:hypothetical protein
MLLTTRAVGAIDSTVDGARVVHGDDLRRLWCTEIQTFGRRNDLDDYFLDP